MSGPYPVSGPRAVVHEQPVEMPLADPDVEGLFDFVGDAVSAVGHAVGNVAKGVAHAASDVGKFVGDAAKVVSHAVEDVGKAVGGAVGTVAHLAQIGLSFIPGIGQGLSAAIGAGLALAEGKPITDALIEGVKGAIPGGPLAAMAFDAGAKAVAGVAAGKSLDQIALGAVRDNLPGGDLAKQAFDTAVALTHAKAVQQSGVKPSSLLPKHADALAAFHATRKELAKGLAAKARPIHPPPPPPKSIPRRPAGPLKPRTSIPVLRKPPVPPIDPGAVQGPPPRPSYASAVLHPSSGPPIGSLFDDVIHKGVATAANAMQSATKLASGLPGPAGTVARELAVPATAAAKAASSSPSVQPTHPLVSPAPKRTTAEPHEGSSLVLPLAIGGSALAVAGGTAWWAYMNHKHRKAVAR